MESSSGSSGGVCLTRLPPLVIDKILCCLPIKDAICTNVLSKWWEKRWQCISELKLISIYNFFVFRILLQHTAPIRLFHFDCIDESFLSRDLKFILKIISRRSSSPSSPSSLCTLIIHAPLVVDPDDSDDEVELNLDLVARLFPNLTHLELNCSLYLTENFSGFSHLTTLHLDSFGFPRDKGHLSKLVSSCPFLDTLILNDINQSQSFKIVAPNLRRLRLYQHNFDDFRICDAPLLQTVIIGQCHFLEDKVKNDKDDDDCNLLKGFGGLASMEKLKLDQEILEFLGRGQIPERIHPSFNHLKIMLLKANIGDLKVLPVILCLLKSIPNLQQLTIKHPNFHSNVPQVHHNVPQVRHDFWMTQECGNLFDKLEMMTTRIMGDDNELDFLRFLLAKVEMVKELAVRFHPYCENMKNMKKLFELPRLSSQARVFLG